MEENTLKSYSATGLPLIERALDSIFARAAARTPDICQPVVAHIREFSLRPGKRIRPLLVLLGYEGYAGQGAPLSVVHDMAALVEMMHAFLLVHDDIVDRAQLRRGLPVMHRLLGDEYKAVSCSSFLGHDLALIAGDQMMFWAMAEIARADMPGTVKNRFLEIFADTYEKTAWGQIVDLLNTQPVELDPQSPLPEQVCLLKTAWYTMCNPLLMGRALRGCQTDAEDAKIEEFALPLGVAFQLRDDLLGVFGNHGETGKSADSDLMEGKLTILAQETMRRLDKADRHTFAEMLAREAKSPEDCAMLRRMMETNGARAAVTARMFDELSRSQQALEGMTIAPAQKCVLEDLIRRISVIDN